MIKISAYLEVLYMKTYFLSLAKGLIFLLLILILIFAFHSFSKPEQTAPAKAEKITTMTYEDLMKQQVIVEGKALFVEKCAACHPIGRGHDFFFGRIADNEYDPVALYAFIRNSDSVIKSGNVYYSQLFEEYNKTRMTAFPELTDNQIDKIISYIKVKKVFQNLPKK